MKVGIALVVLILFFVSTTATAQEPSTAESAAGWEKEPISCPSHYSYRYSRPGCQIAVQDDRQGVCIHAQSGNQTSCIIIAKTPNGKPGFAETTTQKTDQKEPSLAEVSYSRGDQRGHKTYLVDNPGQTGDDIFAKACRPYLNSLPPEVKSAFLGFTTFKVGP